MKKLFAVLLALGLIVAFSATASAVDVKFSGEYYLAGVYDDNPSLKKEGYSRAYFYQRIRIAPVFQIAEGLSLSLRFDTLEKQWGNTEWRGSSGAVSDSTNSRLVDPTNNSKIQESFEMEHGFLSFKTKMGAFDVGYMTTTWGTIFGESPDSNPKIIFTMPSGPFVFIAQYEKWIEANKNDYTADDTKTDADSNYYSLAGIYNFKGGSAGLRISHVRDASERNHATDPYTQTLYVFEPYMRATFGPIYVESEVGYVTGTAKDYELPSTLTDVDREAWRAYVMAKMNMGPASFGAQIAWASGDDSDTAGKNEEFVYCGSQGCGLAYSPALIIAAEPLATWSGGDNNVSTGVKKSNILILNAFGNYAVTPKFSMGAALTYAKRNKVAAGVEKDVGTELDITATYKIYNNLSYMVGAGYLWAGDNFKTTAGLTEVDNDYILLNKLTLAF